MHQSCQLEPLCDLSPTYYPKAVSSLIIMNIFETNLDLNVGLGPLGRGHTYNAFVDPEELHFANHTAASSPQEVPRILRSSSMSSEIYDQVQGNWSSLADVSEPLNVHTSPPEYSLDPTVADNGPTKSYAPRRRFASRRSKTPPRVKPRNGRHARELGRNRHAAASYRSRQKDQLDTLLNRVRDEQSRMLEQREMVYSLKVELFQLRNALMAHQQIHVFGTNALNPVQQPQSETMCLQSFDFAPPGV
jgi:hypothetical protein